MGFNPIQRMVVKIKDASGEPIFLTNFGVLKTNNVMSEAVAIPQRPVRQFLPENFKITSWETLKPYFDDLLGRSLSSLSDLKTWLHHRSELESIISEDMGWRYIRM